MAEDNLENGCLPAIDMGTAVERMGGNEALFFKVLLYFVEAYSDFMLKLHTDLKEGNFDDARVGVHTMKGIAGSLSATALFDSAQAVERALRKEKKSDLDECISQLENRFCETIAFGLKILKSGERAGCVGKESENTVSPGPQSGDDNSPGMTVSQAERIQMAPFLDELHECIELHDPAGAEHSLRALMSLVAGRFGMAQLRFLSKDLEDYNFEQALKSLDDFADVMDICSTRKKVDSGP